MRAPKKQRVGRENERRHLFLSLSLGTLLFEPCNLDVWYTATKLDVKFSFPPSAEVRRRRSYGITEFPPPPPYVHRKAPFYLYAIRKGQNEVVVVVGGRRSHKKRQTSLSSDPPKQIPPSSSPLSYHHHWPRPKPPSPPSSSYTPFLQFHPSATRRTDTQTSQKEGGDKRPILYVRTSLPPKPRTEETNKKGFLLLFKRVLHDSLLGEKGREMFYCLFQRKKQ